MFNSFNYYKSKIKYGNKRLEDSTWIYVLSEGFGYLGSLPYKNGDAAVVAVVAVAVYFCLASSQEQLILPQIILVTIL